MTDRILAGYRVVGSHLPIQLYAGEKQVVTTQGTVAADQTLGQINDEGNTYRFPVVALVGGELVEWDSTAADVEVTGGAEDQTAPAPVTKPYGILPHAIDTTDEGYDGVVDSPVIVEAVINFEALHLPNDESYEEVKAAFAGTGIVIQRLY